MPEDRQDVDGSQKPEGELDEISRDSDLSGGAAEMDATDRGADRAPDRTMTAAPDPGEETPPPDQTKGDEVPKVG